MPKLKQVSVISHVYKVWFQKSGKKIMYKIYYMYLWVQSGLVQTAGKTITVTFYTGKHISRLHHSKDFTKTYFKFQDFT